MRRLALTALLATLCAPAHADPGDQPKISSHAYPDPLRTTDFKPYGVSSAGGSVQQNSIQVDAFADESYEQGPPLSLDAPFPGQSTATTRAGIVRPFTIEGAGTYDVFALLVPTRAFVDRHIDLPSTFVGLDTVVSAGLDVRYSCALDACADTGGLGSSVSRAIACDSAGTCDNPGSILLIVRISVPAGAPGIIRAYAWLGATATARGPAHGSAHGDTVLSQLYIQKV